MLAHKTPTKYCYFTLQIFITIICFTRNQIHFRRGKRANHLFRAPNGMRVGWTKKYKIMNYAIRSGGCDDHICICCLQSTRWAIKTNVHNLPRLFYYFEGIDLYLLKQMKMKYFSIISKRQNSARMLVHLARNWDYESSEYANDWDHSYFTTFFYLFVSHLQQESAMCLTFSEDDADNVVFDEDGDDDDRGTQSMGKTNFTRFTLPTRLRAWNL